MAAVNTNPPVLSAKDIKRFWSKVDKAPGHGPQGECWKWTAVRYRNGYGNFFVGGKRKCSSHRIAFLLATRIWSSKMVCHECDNRLCCNPSHMFEGSAKDNQHDMAVKGRSPQGSRHGMSKLSEQQVLEIRALYKTGLYDYLTIASRFGVSRHLISLIVRRKWWKHI